MLRRINVDLAAAIWYVEKDKCGWKSEETT